MRRPPLWGEMERGRLCGEAERERRRLPSDASLPCHASEQLLVRLSGGTDFVTQSASLLTVRSSVGTVFVTQAAFRGPFAE